MNELQRLSGMCLLSSGTNDNPLAATMEKVPALKTRLERLFEAWGLEEKRSQEAREHYALRMEIERGRHKPALSPPPQKRVARDICFCQEGKYEWWPRLTLDLSLKPDSPGWKAADAATRRAVVEWKPSDSVLAIRARRAPFDQC